MGSSSQLSTCVLFWDFLGLFVPAVEGTKPRSSLVSSQANAILSRNNVTLLALLDIFRCKVKRLVENFLQTAQLAAMTLTFDPLTLKLVHGVLISQGPFLPSSVFLGHFVFALGGGTRRTNKRTDGRNGRCHGNEVTHCKGSLRQLPNIKLIGQQAVKL